MSELDRLEEVARKATPGEWTLWGTASPSQAIAAETGFVAQTVGGNDEANAAYIAAMNPQTALKLIAVARAAQTYYERYAQDEAADGEYSCAGRGGQITGCSDQQGKDALALRVALKGLKCPKT